MSRALIASVLTGLLVIFYLVPRLMWKLVEHIEQYIFRITADPRDVALKDRQR